MLGYLVTLWPWYWPTISKNLISWDLFSHAFNLYDYIWLRYVHAFQDIDHRTCSRHNHFLNMNIFIHEVNLKISCADLGFWKSPKAVSIFFLPLTIFRNRNRNLCVSERCPTSHRLWQYLFPNKKWQSYGNFKIWPTFWPGDVTSAWHIISTTTHLHLYPCKILLLWHQSFLHVIKSSGQT